MTYKAATGTIQVSIQPDGLVCGANVKVGFDGTVQVIEGASDNANGTCNSVMFQCYGIVGKLGYGTGHLIVITERDLVTGIKSADARIWNIKGVTLVPLVYEQALEVGQRISGAENSSATETPQTTAGSSADPCPESVEPPLVEEPAQQLENNIGERSQWRRWFLNRTSPEPTPEPEAENCVSPSESSTHTSEKADSASPSLVAKMVAYINAVFSSGAFYYAENWDLTNYIQCQGQAMRPTFCYNYHMGKDFRGTCLELNIIQGYVGSASAWCQKEEFAFLGGGQDEVLGEGLAVRNTDLEGQGTTGQSQTEGEECESKTSTQSGGVNKIGDEVKFLLISRKSTKRAGVRYNRRGIDSRGYCANWAETEQSLVFENETSQVKSHPATEPQQVPYSYSTFLQVRGSMPIYFGQSPYKLRPTPRVLKTEKDTETAFGMHFDRLTRDFHEVVGINLVERPPSKEGAVGCMYADLAFNKGVYVEWFDFHEKCKGMQFAQVTQLFDTEVGAKLLQFGWTDPLMDRRQSGVFRLNCVDCLDRTNVVESIIARKVLELQMTDRKIKFSNKDQDNEFYTKHFRRLWADNGDAISRQYSSTNALKGDFTRTSKRQYKGILTDVYLTLSRYFHGMVSDFFAQTVIDYMLGNVTEAVFGEFEQHLVSRDPALNFDTVRRSTVDVASSIVLHEGEALVGETGGWWVQIPRILTTSGSKLKPRANKLMALVECIFLVTTSALYVCEFDLSAEKVTEFHRIPASSVIEVHQGAFFGKILSRASRDPALNRGFLIKYRLDADPETQATLAIRVPILQAAEYEQIAAAFSAVQGLNIEHKDIVTLAEATSETKLWGRLEYFVKKAVWA